MKSSVELTWGKIDKQGFFDSSSIVLPISIFQETSATEYSGDQNISSGPNLLKLFLISSNVKSNLDSSETIITLYNNDSRSKIL